MRKINKTAAVLTAAVLSVGMAGNVLAAAGTDNITSVPGTKSDIAVTGTYQAGTTSDTVYKVDIKWGSMSFTYTAAAQGSWNPDSHQYNNAGTSGTWAPTETDANEITVTNHSNAAVTAELTFAAEGSNGITAAFRASDTDTTEKNILNLASADNGVDGAPGKAVSDNSFLVITGGTLEADAADIQIGTVTVAIDA